MNGVLDAILASRVGVAVMALVAAILAVVAVILLWESVRQLIRRQRARGQLERIAREGNVRDATSSGILRHEKKRGLDWLEALLLRLPRHGDLNHLLQQADVDWSVGSLLLLTLGVGFGVWVFALVLGIGGVGGVLLGAVGATLPWLWVGRRKRKRLRAFEERFPDALDLLGRSIRAGHAFTTGLEVIADEMPEPVAGEFRQVFEEQKFGLSLRESLFGLADRVDLVDVRMFVTSVMIQRESGGNLAENLDNLSTLIRERFKFRRTLRTHTAQGRLTGYILAAAPIFMLGVLMVLNPEYERLLFTEQFGRLMLVGAATMQFVGFLFIRRIIDVEF